MDFNIVPSLQYASFGTRVNDLRTEFELRRKHGFEIEWLDSRDVSDKFAFAAPTAVLVRMVARLTLIYLPMPCLRILTKHGHGVLQ